LLQKRGQKLTLFLKNHVLVFTPARSRSAGGTRHLPVHEAPTQLTGPTRRRANNLGRVSQTQAIAQRQDNSLSLTQLLYRLG
jgi:hypothetical protein